MNRFDKNFHEVDIETSRPFSAGHPDGIWMASILYGLPIIGLLIGLVITLLMTVISGSPGWQMVGMMAAGFVGISVIFAPIIILFFRRSKKAFSYSVLLSAVFAAIFIASYLSQPHQALVPAIILLLQLFGVYYFWGLTRDKLLR